jgi:hypothetical protein
VDALVAYPTNGFQTLKNLPPYPITFLANSLLNDMIFFKDVPLYRYSTGESNLKKTKARNV